MVLSYINAEHSKRCLWDTPFPTLLFTLLKLWETSPVCDFSVLTQDFFPTHSHVTALVQSLGTSAVTWGREDCTCLEFHLPPLQPFLYSDCHLHAWPPYVSFAQPPPHIHTHTLVVIALMASDHFCTKEEFFPTHPTQCDSLGPVTGHQHCHMGEGGLVICSPITKTSSHLIYLP